MGSSMTLRVIIRLIITVALGFALILGGNISRNVTSIHGMGEENAAGAEQTASASRELASLAEQLQLAVSGFRLEQGPGGHG